jgi:hypothetical protein
MSSSLYSSSTAANTALAGACAAAAAGGSLNARTYYESVTPSTWRPTDAEAAAPGDYLELYRCVAHSTSRRLHIKFGVAQPATSSACRTAPKQCHLLICSVFALHLLHLRR